MARPVSDSPTLFELPSRPDFALETRARSAGQWPVAGLDEAGRGPLAGPVVAAAVILDPDCIPEGLDDSKRLTAEARERLFAQLSDCALAISVASLSATAIDRINILRASLEAMRRALAGLSMAPALALADGRDVPPGLPCPARAVVKGDRISQSIAAASIVAKVTRDRMMTRTCGVHPGYGFSSHMGYATEVHRTAILARGRLTRIHRMTFGMLREDE
ncbi:MAG: ribonuclease HII [Rhizobiales bacterium]|jgi:ribonuclease HII|nr:ribonuclease HII [Hyphomicrobiales bacterium]